MEKIVFENGAKKDIDGIVKVHVEGWKETYIGIVPDDYLDKLSIEQGKLHWRALFEDNKTEVIICKIDGEIIGFVTYGKEQHGYANYDGEMYALYLLKSHHGQGIGNKLFEMAKSGLKDLGYKSMLIWALAENKTCNFYLKKGGKKEYKSKRDFGGKVLEEQSFGWKL